MFPLPDSLRVWLLRRSKFNQAGLCEANEGEPLPTEVSASELKICFCPNSGSFSLSVVHNSKISSVSVLAPSTTRSTHAQKIQSESGLNISNSSR